MPRGRPRKRKADELANEQAQDVIPDNDAGKTDAGGGRVIDFAEIIRASNILPPSRCGTEPSMDPPITLQSTNLSPQTHMVIPTAGLAITTTATSINPTTQQNTLATLALPPLPVVSDVAVHNLGQISPFRLANEDLAAHVPASLKSQISKGEFINLSLLLKGAVELAEICNGSVLRLSADGVLETRRRECKDKISSIEKWTNAFLIFASVYLQSHSDQTNELLHYMYNIRECAVRQNGDAWRVYDEQFRLRQASNPAPWSVINNDLWWRCILVRDTSEQPKPASDRFKYTCHDYNKGSCRWPNCRFTHACAQCGDRHPQANCPTNQTFSVASQGSTTRTPNSNFRGRPFQRNFRGRVRGSFGTSFTKQ